MKKERCVICHKKIKMQMMKNTGYCSQRCEDVGLGTQPRGPVGYPHKSGDTVVLGPGVIYDPSEDVINYRGDNYRPGPGWQLFESSERVYDDGSRTAAMHVGGIAATSWISIEGFPFDREENSSPSTAAVLYRCNFCNRHYHLDEITGGLLNHNEIVRDELCPGSGRVPHL